MPDGMYPAPVIPGAHGARRAPLAAGAAQPARHGQPGHLERIWGRTPAGVWTFEQRWWDLQHGGDQ
jgi:hypothetical protein